MTTPAQPRPQYTSSPRPRPRGRAWIPLLTVSVLALSAQVAILAPAQAATTATAPVSLGSATTFSVLGGGNVASSGPSTLLSGDLGISTGGAVSGFGPGQGKYLGALHDKDSVADGASSARVVAYADAASRSGATEFSGDQAGRTFGPGVNHSSTAFANSGTVTLDADGDPDAVFIFQVGAAFSPAATSAVVLTDGAQADNVFWQVNGAVSIGADAHYVGTFLVHGAFTLGSMSTLQGRVLTDGAVTLTNNVVTTPAAPAPVTPTDPAEPAAPGTPAAPAAQTSPAIDTAAGPRYRPDASIRGAGGRAVGSGIFTGAKQQVRTRLQRQDRTVRFVVRLSNRGTQIDQLQVRGTSLNPLISVTYTAAGVDVSRAVRAGSFVTRALGSDTSVRLVVTVTRSRTTTALNRGAFRIRVSSLNSPAIRDTVGATVRWGL